MTYVIDTNIPMPTPIAERSTMPKMNIGDSFFLLFEGDNKEEFSGRIRSRVYAWSKRSGQRFTVRIVDGGIRVWRIA